MSKISLEDKVALATLIDQFRKVSFKDVAEAHINKQSLKTIKEFATTTSNFQATELVNARISMQLLTLMNAKQFCRIEPMAQGEGLKHMFQKVAVPSSSYGGTHTENTASSAQDLTLGYAEATLGTKDVYTVVSDEMARASAWNVMDAVGRGHANALVYIRNGLIYTELKTGVTTSPIAVGTSADAKSTNYTFESLLYGKGKVEAQRWRPNLVATYPIKDAEGSGGAATGFYPFVLANITSVQFTSALANFVQTGVLPNIFGLPVFIDQAYAPTSASTDGAVMASILQTDETIGWCEAEDITAEIQRSAKQIGYDVVSHFIGGVKLIQETALSNIRHATS